jgi:homospermidine synthase
MVIGGKPPMSFAIANNMLAPNNKVVDLRISSQVITIITWNHFENPKDGSFGRNILRNVHIPS